MADMTLKEVRTAISNLEGMEPSQIPENAHALTLNEYVLENGPNFAFTGRTQDYTYTLNNREISEIVDGLSEIMDIITLPECPIRIYEIFAVKMQNQIYVFIDLLMDRHYRFDEYPCNFLYNDFIDTYNKVSIEKRGDFNRTLEFHDTKGIFYSINFERD